MIEVKLAQLLERRTGWSKRFIDKARADIGAFGALPRVAGRYLPDLTFEQVAGLLIALAGARRQADVPAAFLKVRGLVPLDPSGRGLLGGETFLEDLAGILAAPDAAAEIQSVSVCQHRPYARIRGTRPGKEAWYVAPEDAEEFRRRIEAGATGDLGSHGAFVWAELGGPFLHQLALELEEPTEDDAPDAEWGGGDG